MRTKIYLSIMTLLIIGQILYQYGIIHECEVVDEINEDTQIVSEEPVEDKFEVQNKVFKIIIPTNNALTAQHYTQCIIDNCTDLKFVRANCIDEPYVFDVYVNELGFNEMIELNQLKRRLESLENKEVIINVVGRDYDSVIYTMFEEPEQAEM